MPHLWPFGPYELLRLLGVGGMAEVYLARPRGTDRRVVVKRVRSDLDARPDLVTSFVDEALLVSRLSAGEGHPNIVGVLDVGEVQGAVYMALELVDGPDVRRVLVRASEGGPAPSAALSAWIVARAADGLHHAHEATDATTLRPLGIVHRDVSPQNILLSREGGVKVADFGIALTTDRLVSLTDPGHVKGKHGYISPEQARGELLDRRSDVFSLGVVLYELLTREKLFKKRDDPDVVGRAEMAAAPDPREIVPSLDDEIAEIVARALAPDRAHRYASAGELARALDRWAAARLTTEGSVELARFVASLGPSFVDLPPPGSRDLGDVTESLEPTVAPAPRPSVTPFVGREHELETLRAAIAGGARLVVVVAAEAGGGSRLLRALAPLVAQRLTATTRVIELHHPGTADDAAQACALALDAGGAATIDDVVDACAAAVPADGPSVWLLDDATPAAAPLLVRLLAALPSLVVVATARAPLGVVIERIHELAPLVGPARDDELALSPAGRALLSRAHAARGRPVDIGERPAFAALARLSGGSPLALELTAGRTRARSAEELGRELAARITAPPVDEAARQDTLAACVAGALDDLSAADRRGLLRLAAFAAPFTRAAAIAVLDDEDEAHRTLAALGARALVVPAEEAGVAVERFTVHVVVRRAIRARSPRVLVEHAERRRARVVALAQPIDAEGRSHLAHELLDVHARGLASGSPAGIERALWAAARAASLSGIDVPRGAAARLLASALATAAGRGVRAAARARALDALGRTRLT